MCDETIKISIIVPIYNVEDYVKPCIESIMGQSYRNLEIILVDDGSTDRCPEICDHYAEKDKRIHVIHKQNGGVTSARKAGVAAATGDYVLGVDGDDWIEKDRVEELVRDGILPTHADMIYLAGWIKDFGKEVMRENFDVSSKLFKNNDIEIEVFPRLSKEKPALGGDISWMLVTWAIRRELLLNNLMLVDDRIIDGEDFLCTCFCLMEAKSVMIIQQDGYHYVQRVTSIGHQIMASYHIDLSRIKILYQVLKSQLKLRQASEKIQKVCARVIIWYIMRYDYDVILNRFSDYLFPFPKVNSGARIVVYGAGKMGYSLVQNLDKTKKCSVVLWVDQNQNLPTLPGYTISSRDMILSADYDFVVVAIMNGSVATEVKRSLVLDGIPEEKIATIDGSVITEDAIPDEMRSFQI